MKLLQHLTRYSFSHSPSLAKKRKEKEADKNVWEVGEKEEASEFPNLRPSPDGDRKSHSFQCFATQSTFNMW